MHEQERIAAAYAARGSHHYFGYEAPHHLMRVQERYRATLNLLFRHGYHPLADKRILDVGCADGVMLRKFVEWGAQPHHLAGVDLRAGSLAQGRLMNRQIGVCLASGARLPYPDESFDLVCQHTVFTSILDSAIKHQVAGEMMRVLRTGGLILWYDFHYDNPRNPDVKGIKRAEIGQLFPGWRQDFVTITLAPPLARRIPARWLALLYPLLAAVPPLRTHDLGLIGPNP